MSFTNQRAGETIKPNPKFQSGSQSGTNVLQDEETPGAVLERDEKFTSTGNIEYM